MASPVSLNQIGIGILAQQSDMLSELNTQFFQNNVVFGIESQIGRENKDITYFCTLLKSVGGLVITDLRLDAWITGMKWQAGFEATNNGIIHTKVGMALITKDSTDIIDGNKINKNAPISQINQATGEENAIYTQQKKVIQGWYLRLCGEMDRVETDAGFRNSALTVGSGYAAGNIDLQDGDEIILAHSSGCEENEAQLNGQVRFHFTGIMSYLYGGK